MKTIYKTILTLMLLTSQNFGSFNPYLLIGNAGPDLTLNITPTNQAVFLDASGTQLAQGTSISTYEWWDGDTYIGSNISRWYTPIGTGVHLITLKVTDSDGSQDEDTATITVSNTIIANAGADRTVSIPTGGGAIPTVDLNGSASIAGTNSTGIISHDWYENGVLIGSGAIFTYPITSIGVHTLTLKVTDDTSTIAEDTMILTVNTLPSGQTGTLTANAGGNKTLNVTSSNTAIFLDGSASTSSEGIVKYQWFEDGVFIGPNVSRWYVLNGSGIHTITLKVTDATGAIDENTMILTVNN